MSRLLLIFLAMSCTATPAQVVKQPAGISAVETAFYVQVMTYCQAPLADGRKQVLANQITRIARHYFQTREQQEAFGFLICIESKFQDSAKSKSGAIGLTQIIPSYAQEFSTKCGLGKIRTADLLDAEVSLQLGACQFSWLLNQNSGNIALALAAYNAGQYSQAVKSLSRLQTPNQETAGYVAKYGVLRAEFDTHD